MPILRFLDRLLDVLGGAGVEGLDDEQARLGRGDERELLELHRRAVGFHVDVFDERGRGLAGAHGGKFVLHVFEAFFHRGLGFEEDFVGVHKALFGGDERADLLAEHDAA